MAEDKEKTIQAAIGAIEKYGLIFQEELWPFLHIVRSTFFEWNLHKSDTIRDALNNNKIKTKVGLRKKMYDSSNTSDRAMLYKLCGTQEERDILNNKHIVEIKRKEGDDITDEEKLVAMEAIEELRRRNETE